MLYETTIGLEIHAELLTKTKMFCSCLNESEEKQPNKNICSVCMGHPGTLPVINIEALRKVLKVGLSLNSNISSYSKFDRKNYFYPDLPKGYQISQYDNPLCKDGKLKLFLSDEENENQKEVKITRVHLEEDTARLIHPKDGKSTLIDFNRAGVPLMELVTEPVIHNGKEARLFCQGLQILLKDLDVSEAEMEKGQMRCEVNISLKPIGQRELGTKVEIKNLNSFKAVEKAIEYELKRQTEVLEKGEKVIQETRGWDPIKEVTYPQRTKEEAQDYRYFPEPDLPPLNVYKLFNFEELKKELKELPWLKKERIIKEYDLSLKEADILLKDSKVLEILEETIKILKTKNLDIKKATNLAKNYLLTDILGIKEKEKLTYQEIKITPLNFSKIIENIVQNKISSRVAKDILLEIIKTGQDPEKLITERSLETISDIDLINPIIEEVIKNNPKAVEDYKKGKETAIQFLVGQAMAKLKGAADPKELVKIMENKIKK
ncbi:MAG TPA: Asp-tRNA(Asn)/Glu-tRNA(Gln) amidotransferase subunit GatB [Candidatus Paceibacterota bacterium]|nr:Asp-tRNA(Asn)/Glu-tRNA(Gln) amidotransferase subunit GatB [Candidatus Paceibacterota bacterium]